MHELNHYDITPLRNHHWYTIIYPGRASNKLKMDWSYSEKVITVYCRAVGITYFGYNNNNCTTTIKIWTMLIPIFYYTLAFYCVITTVLDYNQVYSDDAESILVASDFLAVVGSGSCLAGRGFYYFIKRNELADLVCKVIF